MTTLVLDQNSNFLLSGAADSNIHVWSLPDILSWSNNASSSHDPSNSLRHTLSNHRAAITSLVLGHSASFLNIAVSASEDKTCTIWNYQNGQALRTYLFPSTPLCLALDPADRYFYTGFEDGSVQLVRLYDHASAPMVNVNDPSQAQHAIKVQEKDRLAANGQDLGTTLSMGLSYDGMTLLTGHENGKIICWDIGGARFQSTLCDLRGPVTNLQFETPAGFAGDAKEPPYKIHSITKPRFDLSTTGQGMVPAAYTLTGQFAADLPNDSSRIYESGRLSGHKRFEQALLHPSFPSDLLESGIAELAALRTKSSRHANGLVANEHDADFLPLDDDAMTPMDDVTTAHPDGTEKPIEGLEVENHTLRDQVTALQRTLNASFDQIEHLRREQKVWSKWEQEKKRKRDEAQDRRRERTERIWAGENVDAEIEASPGDSSSSPWESSDPNED